MWSKQRDCVCAWAWIHCVIVGIFLFNCIWHHKQRWWWLTAVAPLSPLSALLVMIHSTLDPEVKIHFSHFVKLYCSCSTNRDRETSGCYRGITIWSILHISVSLKVSQWDHLCKRRNVETMAAMGNFLLLTLKRKKTDIRQVWSSKDQHLFWQRKMSYIRNELLWLFPGRTCKNQQWSVGGGAVLWGFSLEDV